MQHCRQCVCEATCCAVQHVPSERPLTATTEADVAVAEAAACMAGGGASNDMQWACAARSQGKTADKTLLRPALRCSRAAASTQEEAAASTATTPLRASVNQTRAVLSIHCLWRNGTSSTHLGSGSGHALGSRRGRGHGNLLEQDHHLLQGTVAGHIVSWGASQEAGVVMQQWNPQLRQAAPHVADYD